jgi:hypothetical protein
LPASAAREALGAPTAVVKDTGRPTTTWHFRLGPGGSELRVAIDADSVEAWQVDIRRPDLPLARRGWPDRTASARMLSYLEDHPELADSSIFAMVRGCPVTGLQSEAILVSLGRPSLVDTIMHGDSTIAIRWMYPLGIEGERMHVLLTRDTVTGWTADLRWTAAVKGRR